MNEHQPNSVHDGDEPSANELELDRLLALLEQHVDPDHCREVDDRYRAALSCEDVDRPPLVVRLPFSKAMKLPPPWCDFRVYSYREAFADPIAMMQNQVLSSVVPGVLLRDDSPLLIRGDFGTIQIASLLGADWEQLDDNPPWVRRLAGLERVEEIVNGDATVDLRDGGLMSRSLSVMQFYRKKLQSYENLKQTIQVAMPDLQGPLDTADQIWPSDFFVAVIEQPELISQLLSAIVDVMLQVIPRFRELTIDRLDPHFNAQHAWEIPGRLLIRDDSAILISGKMYANQIGPHDGRLLEAVGGGSIHFCGNGEHLVDAMLDVPGMKGFDFGQPWMMDVPRVYEKTRQARIPYTNQQPPRDDLISGRANRDFPTGVVLTYETDDLEEARNVVSAAQSH